MQVLLLLGIWTQGAYVHLLRALPVLVEWARQIDVVVIGCVEELVGTLLAAAAETHGIASMLDFEEQRSAFSACVCVCGAWRLITQRWVGRACRRRVGCDALQAHRQSVSLSS